MPSMYQSKCCILAMQCNLEQYYAILLHINKYCKILQHYYDILCMSTKCHKHICKYVLMKMLHTCHAMQFATILCHIIIYQQDIAKYCSNITCMNNIIQGMVQQIGKSSLLNSQCKFDLVGNGSRVVYLTISATYISIPNL